MNQLYVTNSGQTAGTKAADSSGIKSGSGAGGKSGSRVCEKSGSEVSGKSGSGVSGKSDSGVLGKSGVGVLGKSGADVLSAPDPKSPLNPGVDSTHGANRGSRASAAHPATAAGSISPDSPAGKTTVKQDWKSQKEEQALQRKKQNALKKTEAQIAALEEQDAALDHRLTQPEVVSDVGKLIEIHKEKEAIKERLDQLYEEWETLAEDI